MSENKVTVKEKREWLKNNGYYQEWSDDTWLEEGVEYSNRDWSCLPTDVAYKEGKRKKTGEKIAAIRKDIGLTQKNLAKKVGTSQIHISRIEKGVSSPSFEIITKIAEALSCKTDDFLE